MSAVTRAISFCVLAGILLQCVGQAQSSKERNEGPASAGVGLHPKTLPDGEPNQTVPTQRLVCSSGYTQKRCHEEMVILRRALAIYPLTGLGDWTWVLVQSQEWKAIMVPRGLDPDSPAFTFYPKRETFIEEALVTPMPARENELLLKWGMSRESLLDFAIRHELGHAICKDSNEKHADHVAELLKHNKAITFHC